MVRTVQTAEVAQGLPDVDLWAQLKDEVDPTVPGKSPWWIKNLLTLKPFKERLVTCLERPLGGIKKEQLIEHCTELQRLRMCIKMAYGLDFLDALHGHGRNYPKKLNATLQIIDHEIDMYRLSMHLRACQIGAECEDEISGIEHGEPPGYRLWLPGPEPIEGAI